MRYFTIYKDLKYELNLNRWMNIKLDIQRENDYTLKELALWYTEYETIKGFNEWLTKKKNLLTPNNKT